MRCCRRRSAGAASSPVAAPTPRPSRPARRTSIAARRAATRRSGRSPCCCDANRARSIPWSARRKPRQVAWIDDARCIGCALCIPACPVDAIVGAQKLAHTVIADHCTGCELCLPPCPVDCIELRAARDRRARHASAIARPEDASMRAASAFPVGLALVAHKRQALQSPLACAAPPAIAIIALDQGNGRTALPSVAQGDRVKLGQPIAIDPQTRCNAIHAPVAGRVLAIDVRPDGSEGATVPASPSRTTARTRVIRDSPRSTSSENAEPETLLARIANAGIVGLGGAAFPAAVKLAAARARGASHLVLNGAECEPWICCDDALMRARAPQIVQGALLLLRATGAARCTIAVEDDKPEAIAALADALSAAGDERIELRSIAPVYPAGAERQLLATITGIEVPTGRLPSDAGLLCHNVGTAAAVAEFAATGMPCLRRIVTITGSGVANPGNLDAWIGTPIADLVAQRGGYLGTPERLIAGGTLTGRALVERRGRAHEGDELPHCGDRRRPRAARRRSTVHSLRRLRIGLSSRAAAAATASRGGHR